MTNNHIPPQYWSRTIFYLFLSDYFYIIHRAVKGVWCLKSKSRGLGDSMVILMSQSRGLGDSMVILMSQSSGLGDSMVILMSQSRGLRDSMVILKNSPSLK
jgi:hypothetical protein